MKKRTLLFLLMTLIFSMSSCSLYNPIKPKETFIDFEGDGYYRKSQYSEYYSNIYSQQPKELDKSLYSQMYYKFNYLPSTGNQKILVIPVEFKDYPASSLKGGEKGSINYINQAFFGNPYNTFYESVASYYNKSSYGHLSLEGKVSNWFKTNKTVEEVKRESIYQIQSQHVLQDAIEWYRETYDDIDEFDQNKDGYIDAVWLIYSAPHMENDSFLWAHTYYDHSNGYSAKPYASMYSWASYDFMFYQTNKPETHVYIHETGHLLGLKDYYSVDVDKQFAPTCYFDMMDTNIGDHNAFSKILLNWTTPYVIEDECEITIGSFTETGDCILLSPSWNGSAMDEYLLLEYYTPTYLHKADSNTGWQYKNLKESGLRVYHVDARVGFIRNFGGNMDGYLDVVDPEELPQPIATYHLDFAHTNSYSTTIKIDKNPNYLLRLLRAKEYEKEGTPADENLLFKVGDNFSERLNDDKYVFKFNSFDEVPYSFEVTNMDKSTITIKFIKR